MSVIHAIILGIIQGITEFLPVSSFGHLCGVQDLLGGTRGSGVLFEVMLHLGTMIALILVFLKDIKKIGIELLKIHIIGKCLSQITGTQDDHRMNGIQSQDLTDLCIKIVYIIAIPLLPKTAKIIKILTDLRSCGMHLLT